MLFPLRKQALLSAAWVVSAVALSAGAVSAQQAADVENANKKPAVSEPKKTAATPAPMEKTFPVPSDEELRKKLTPEEYAVVRQNATERPFTNKYWQHKEEGIYVDIVTGKPLFSSRDKFDTDCGWPGFAKPIEDAEVKQLRDMTHGMVRVEVRSATGDAHLGHVFDDGPKELGGKRYCINSASLRFIPKGKMAESGYGAWLKLFEAPAPKEK